MESTSRIVLNRSSEWVNRARSLKVLVDGQQVGTIRNGNTEEFRIAPGAHTVTCKIDWCSSRDFEVNVRAEETAYLHVRSGLKYYWLFLAPLMMGLIVNFLLRFTPGGRPEWFNYVLIAIGVPALLYLFYFLTFGRKDYLVISRDEKTLFAR